MPDKLLQLSLRSGCPLFLPTLLRFATLHYVEDGESREVVEKLLASTSSTGLPTVETPTVPCTDNITWEGVAQPVNCDRTLFLDTMKTWTVQQKETLPGLLAECGNELSGVPRPNWLGARQIAGCRT